MVLGLIVVLLDLILFIDNVFLFVGVSVFDESELSWRLLVVVFYVLLVVGVVCMGCISFEYIIFLVGCIEG